MGTFQQIKFDQHGDQRGSLVAVESYKNIPFDIKRVYYLFDTNIEASRGYHAHKNLEQILICVQGSCDLKVENKNTVEWFKLDSPAKGVYIKDLVWREMHNFTENCVLLVIASNCYSEEDYIRSYDEFKRLTLNE